MRRTFALGVDLGTGSVRAFLFDAAGDRHAGVRLSYEWRVGIDGTVETDADALVRLVLAAIDGALRDAPADAEITAIGFSALWHTILGVGDDGSAVTPALAWNDTRATTAARRLRERLDAHAYHARTGALLHPAYPPARIVWLREAGDVAAQAARWLSVPEYLWLKLTGSYEAHVSIAAGSGLLDRNTLAWDEAVLDAIGIDAAQLGVVVMERAAVRRGAEVHAAARWPQLRGALWHAPVGDGACANIGSGCTAATQLALSIGTSAALRVLVPHARSDPPAGLWSYPLDRTSALLGGAISNGGLVRTWLRRTLRLPHDDAELDALLLARPPAAHGLTVRPYFAGERSPDWPLDVTGSIQGLRAATSPLDILQAGMEAVAYRIAALRRSIHHAVPAARTIIASGGALQRSRYWPRLLADTLGEPVHVCADVETSSRGAALIALTAAGVFGGLHAVPAVETTAVEPDIGTHAVHAQAMARTGGTAA